MERTSARFSLIELEPDWSKMPAKIPSRTLELLRRCLEKDPKKRKQSAGDLRIDIELALTEPATILTVATDGIQGGRGSRRSQSWCFSPPYSPFQQCDLRENSQPSQSETRLDIVTPATTDPVSFALSPDGRKIVFVASGDAASRLSLRPLDKTTAQPLAGTENGSQPFWSPDNRWNVRNINGVAESGAGKAVSQLPAM
jgi:serine/threonine protein kinase